jgi:hypothetical protein
MIISFTVVQLLFWDVDFCLFSCSTFCDRIPNLPHDSLSNNNRRMEVRKRLDKVVVSPNRIQQWMGVVLVEERTMQTDYNLTCLASSLPQRTGTTLISHTCSHKIKQPYIPTNQTHGITHISRIHEITRQTTA